MQVRNRTWRGQATCPKSQIICEARKSGSRLPLLLPLPLLLRAFSAHYTPGEWQGSFPTCWKVGEGEGDCTLQNMTVLGDNEVGGTNAQKRVTRTKWKV